MEPLKEGIARAAHPGWENMTGPTHIGDVARVDVVTRVDFLGSPVRMAYVARLHPNGTHQSFRTHE